MKRLLLSLLLITTLVAPVGCSFGAESARSEKERETPLAEPGSDLEQLVAGNNMFAFALYQALREEKDNLFYSPYSISLALALAYSGARGETEEQMAEALHFTLPQERLGSAFRDLERALALRGEGAQGKDGEPFRLKVANAIWGQEGFPLLPEYLDVLTENYGVGLRLLDFIDAAEESRVTINEWVSEKTEGRIKDLIPSGVINKLTRLVLTNAIYFNAAWSQPFETSATHDGAFRLLEGGEVEVPMMRQMEFLRYAEGKDYQAVELPYDGRETSMVILLPAPGQFEAVDRWVNAERVAAIVKDLAQHNVALTMPKFELDASLSLGEVLSKLGMPVAFSDHADFSGITGKPDLSISAVVHKAFVSVDEAGTEAAAATAVVIGFDGAIGPDVEVTVDRPFVFLIRDIETDAILFLGRVLDPSG